MRVAALYDVHGNGPALEAVLADASLAGADVVVVGGDVALGPMPVETLGLLRSLGEAVRLVRGNCDREVASPGGEEGLWGERARWVSEQLGDEERAFLGGLPLSVSVEVDGLGPVLFCHGTPRSDEEIVTAISPTERVAETLAGVDEGVVVCGHTHVQFDRAVAGRRLVNAGSVGMPYEDEPGARWALLGPDVELRRTEYDLDAAAAAIRATGFPGADELAREHVLTRPSAREATEHFERLAASATAKTA